MSQENEIFVSLDQLGRITGLQASRLRSIRNRLGHAHERKIAGRIQVDLQGWLPAWLAIRSQDPELHEQRARLLRAQADRMELRFDRERGLFLTAEEAAQSIDDYLRTIQAAHRLLCGECEKKVSERLNEAQREIEKRYAPSGNKAGVRVYPELQTEAPPKKRRRAET